MSEHEKRMFRLGMTLVEKKIGNKAKTENIHKYLTSSKCEALLDAVRLINHISDETKNKHQEKTVRKYSEFAIWIMLQHPDLRVGLEGLLNKFTKHKNVKIDLKPNIGKIDRYILDKAFIFLIKKISSRPTYNIISSEAQSTVNPVAKYIMKDLETALSEMEDEFTKKALKSLLWIGIWIAINDTAYKAQFYYALNKFGNNDLHELSKVYYFEPNDWYINIHTDAHRETERLWARNEIPMHENSLLENPCMAKKQKDKIDRIISKIGGAF